MQDINTLRQQTYQEAVNLLRIHGKCAIIRPTAFGKTGILARFITSGTYRHILYLYPSKAVRNTAEEFCKDFGHENALKRVTFYTYKKIQNLKDSEMKALQDVDLVISDECHKLGAKITSKAYKDLEEYLPDAHFVGATATPDRMDLTDVIGKFYDNIVVTKYTAHDAFTNNVLYRPWYVYCSYEVTDIEEAKERAEKEIALADPKDRPALTVELNRNLVLISNLYKMHRIIREACDKYVKDTSCMSFIIFFSNFKHIRKKQSDVVEWFQGAYPKHKIETITVTSETKEYHENVDVIADLPYKANTIYLILTCDMLNLGYHVSKTTGLFMYRCTNSSTVFVQQMGRIINAYAPGIIFDAVDNLHKHALYQVLGKKSERNVQKRKRLAELEEKLATDPQNENTLTESERKELHNLRRNFDESHWWKHANDLEPQDLMATGHEAKYRELIAKIDAEPRSMRCRQAWARWVEKGGDPSSMDRNVILAQKDPDNVPLPPFCRLKHVSVEAVLKEMGL